MVARKRVQNGIEKDSQEGLKMESSRQKETGKAKMTPKKTLRETKKELTWGTSERDQKREFHGVAALSSMYRSKQRRYKTSVL